MIIIAVVIVSFVILFSPDINFKTMGSRDNRKYVNGKPVTINGSPITNEEFNQSLRETYIASFMRTGGREWPNNDESTAKSLERDAIFRVFLLQKIKEMDIHVSDKALAQAARDRLGSFSLTDFEKQYLLPQRLTLADFERFLEHDMAIQQLISSAAVSSKLYSPQEAEALYRKQHEENETKLAVFWASNYLDRVSFTPQELSLYYSNNMPAYRIPERVAVNYVEFPATNFYAEADKQIASRTNFNADVDTYYYKRGTNTFKDTNGVALSEVDAKKQIRDEIRHQMALLEARRKANEFGTALYNMAQPDNAENLQKQAAAVAMTVKTSPPLERIPPADDKNNDFDQDFRQKAFQLTKDLPVAFNPILGEKAVYLIALKERIPSTVQPFEKVQEKVAADYRNSKAQELARKAGMDFYTTVTNGLANKQTFDAICAQAKVVTITPPRFATATTSLTNLDERISLNALQQLAGELKPGQVTKYTPTDPTRSPEGRYLPPQGGFVLYLSKRIPVDDATVKKELPDYLSRMRNYRQNEVFNQWFRKQIEQAKLYIAPAPETTGITQGS